MWPKTFERYRQVVMGARLIQVTGKLQREGIVTHVIADHLEDLTYRLHTLAGPDLEPIVRRNSGGNDYENNLARANEVKSPLAEARQTNERKMFPSRDFH